MKIVYFAFIDEYRENKLPILCRDRVEYIRSIKCMQRQKQSYSAWKLLQTVLENSEIDSSAISYVNGKWLHYDERVKFSISHSDNVILVGVSTEGDIAVDVEQICDKTTFVTKKLLNKQGAKFNAKAKNAFFAKKWTCYECNVKSDGYQTGVYSHKKIIKDGREYMLTAKFNEKISIIQYK